MLTNFLLKHKIKGRDIKKDEVRNDVGNMAGLIGITLNLLMAVSKIIIGVLISSISVLADGVNNSFDTASSLVTVIGFKMSSKPEDEEHPYGHGRIEYITAVIISIFVVIIGVQFIKASYDRIISPDIVKFDLLSFMLLAISLITKFWLSRFYKKVGDIINSKTLLATSYDSMGDVITTAVVLLPMISTFFTTVQIDGYIGILVSLMIIYNGIKLLKETMSPLIGNPPEPEMVEEIKKEVLKESTISNIHAIRYESYGGEKALMTMDVEMPGNMTLQVAHSYVDKVERRIFDKFNVNLIIHMEPKDSLNDTEARVYKKIKNYILENNWIKGIYDFYIDSDTDIETGYLDIVVDGKNLDMNKNEIYDKTYDELKMIYNIDWKIKVIIDF